MPYKINELIKLDKPLVVFDLETTGLAINMDKIIEIAYLKIMPDGRSIQDDIFLNPEMSVSSEATEIHGLTNDDLADKPTFREKAQELWEIFSNSYYSGFNIINFDLPMLKREFLRVGMDFVYETAQIIDSKVIYYSMEPRTLSAAYKYYCGQEHLDSHCASADVEAAAKILEKQLEKYQEIRDWEFVNHLHRGSGGHYLGSERKFYWRNGEAYLAFSKYRDTPLAEVARTDPLFLEWMIKADFADETKQIIKKALKGIFPRKEDYQ